MGLGKMTVIQQKSMGKIALFLAVFLAVFSLYRAGPHSFVLKVPVVLAADELESANTALINGNFKTVEKLVGQIISKGQQSPEVMAKALLLRGIAYRNQRKYSKAISDFSNAEWLQKLRGVELRRLYAERALAYDAVGQSTLAGKDRQLAGASSLRTAQRQDNSLALNGKGVRKTAVKGGGNYTTELFGGLGNLFGFNSGAKKPEDKVVVKQVGSNKLAVGESVAIREIPTLDSAEAKANRDKIDNKPANTAKKSIDTAKPIKDQKNKVTKTDKDAAPSNSAWAAQRLEADKEALDRLKKERAETQKIAKAKGPIDWDTKVGSTNQKTETRKFAAQESVGPVTLSPETKKTNSGGNPITNLFGAFFGGQTPKNEAPVQPGEEVLSEDQLKVNEKKAVAGTAKRAVAKKPLKKIAALQKPVKKAAPPRVKAKPKPQSRSLYHIQLGAFGEAQAADKFVSRLNNKYKSLLGNKTAMVVETDLGQSRRQYRVYLGPFRSRAKGVKSCGVLKKLGMGCSLVE